MVGLCVELRSSLGVGFALVSAGLLGLLLPTFCWPIFITIMMLWLALGILSIINDQCNPPEPPANAKDWRSKVPMEFRFISDETTVEEVINRARECSRLRELDGIKALQYDLPDGAAVLILPEAPYQTWSRLREVRFYQRRNDIPLFA
jgi:hypothetical protein